MRPTAEGVRGTSHDDQQVFRLAITDGPPSIVIASLLYLCLEFRFRRGDSGQELLPESPDPCVVFGHYST